MYMYDRTYGMHNVHIILYVNLNFQMYQQAEKVLKRPKTAATATTATATATEEDMTTKEDMTANRI